jgi:hypothetical protein
VRFIKGLLSGPPAQALQLDDFAEELYSDDLTGTPIEVAPVPFDDAFVLREPIVETLSAVAGLGDVEVVVNGGAPLTRPFRDVIPVEGGRPLRLREVVFVEIPSVECLKTLEAGVALEAMKSFCHAVQRRLAVAPRLLQELEIVALQALVFGIVDWHRCSP